MTRIRISAPVRRSLTALLAAGLLVGSAPGSALAGPKQGVGATAKTKTAAKLVKAAGRKN